MFGLKLKEKCVAVMLLAGLMASGAGIVQAQSTRRTRREIERKPPGENCTHRQGHLQPQWEVGGGGGYLRYRSGEDLQRNNEVTFWLSGTRYLNPKLGIVADVRGAFGNAKIGPQQRISQVQSADLGVHLYGRPLLSLLRKGEDGGERLCVGGAGVGKFDSGSKGIPSSLLGTWPSETRAAFSVGLNLDYNFYPNLAFRVTPTYLGTTFGGTLQNNAGFNIGLVYRFGRNK